MKIGFVWFLALAFLLLLAIPSASHAGGGGGCGDDSGCNNVMYGIAIGTTVACIVYLYHLHRKPQGNDQKKKSEKDSKELIPMQSHKSKNDSVVL